MNSLTVESGEAVVTDAPRRQPAEPAWQFFKVPCGKCERVFETPQQMTAHLFKERGHWYCAQCSDSFDSRIELLAHCRETACLPYKCPKCPLALPSYSTLFRHGWNRHVPDPFSESTAADNWEDEEAPTEIGDKTRRLRPMSMALLWRNANGTAEREELPEPAPAPVEAAAAPTATEAAAAPTATEAAAAPTATEATAAPTATDVATAATTEEVVAAGTTAEVAASETPVEVAASETPVEVAAPTSTTEAAAPATTVEAAAPESAAPATSAAAEPATSAEAAASAAAAAPVFQEPSPSTSLQGAETAKAIDPSGQRVTIYSNRNESLSSQSCDRCGKSSDLASDFAESSLQISVTSVSEDTGVRDRLPSCTPSLPGSIVDGLSRRSSRDSLFELSVSRREPSDCLDISSNEESCSEAFLRVQQDAPCSSCCSSESSHPVHKRPTSVDLSTVTTSLVGDRSPLAEQPRQTTAPAPLLNRGPNHVGVLHLLYHAFVVLCLLTQRVYNDLRNHIAALQAPSPDRSRLSARDVGSIAGEFS